ncbi:helix-turn-helix domain-containing protein [Halpernia frigidisoli]|uniref:Helix-turn-helix domain-containing protein n=1 Tax=Halpernia frigidisoli TaxID=1125876 RepID=A0A1I3DM39_9FLAO|nr:helix-turn-helix domain-containing protein [Halpernia frigidisoli]SFH87794.1 hypothetical protein SAMN05443292_0572 [Halpernia frigidisoli]
MKPKKQSYLLDEATLQQVVLLLGGILDALNESRPQDAHYYDNADLKRMFNLSDSTLQRQRNANLIPFFKISGKIYYPKAFFNNGFTL